MPSRPYAQIDCSLKGSKKIRGLSSHKAKWAYICAHLSDYCTYTGLFRYPTHIWAYDAQMTPDELGFAIVELCNAGLIDYDEKESFVRIVGWFRKRSGPDNPNRVDSVIGDLSSFEDIEPLMYCRAVSELTVASIKRSLRWKIDAPGRAQLYASLKQFLAETYQDYDDTFLALLNAELDTASETIGTEIRAIFPPLLLTPTSDTEKGYERVGVTLPEHETRRDVNEMNTKKDQNETASFFDCAPCPMKGQKQKPEMPRKRGGPTLSAIQSTIAQAARKG